VQLSHRLWHDRSVFQECADRQVASYLALVRALERHRPLAGEEHEFLALHRFVSALDPEVSAEVLGDPYARLWTRLGFALCRAVLRGELLPPAAQAFGRECGSDEPRSLLALHLDQYKRLALGAALLADAKLVLARPFEVALPMALPGAAASLVGSGAAHITGVADGRIRLESGDAVPAPCPRARVADLSLPLQPHGWLVPGLGWTPSAGRTTLEFQAGQVELVEGGLRLIQRHQPELFAQMGAVLRWIAVNPLSEYDAMNYVSYSELPGAFSFRGMPHPFSAAEASIHEFHHNRLFCLEECEPILAGDALGTEDHAGYYSPWREGLRPLRGILHGAYVTAAQLRFWLAVAKAPDTQGMLADFVTGQLIRQPVVVDLGLGQLERHARFTPEGERLVAQLRSDLEELTAEAGRLGVPWDAETLALAPGGRFEKFRGDDGAPVSVRESIARHVRRYDELRQVPAAWLEANAPRL
jgi:HEXXH motif-containing protein